MRGGYNPTIDRVSLAALEILRAEPMTAPDLAERVGLSPTAAAHRARRWREDGLVRPVGSQHRGGRPALVMRTTVLGLEHAARARARFDPAREEARRLFAEMRRSA